MKLWRNVKYEEIYLKEYNSFADAERSLGEYFHTYNYERIRENLKYWTPVEVYFGINQAKQGKNEAAESLLTNEAKVRRCLMPKSPKNFITPILNNQKVEISHI